MYRNRPWLRFIESPTDTGGGAATQQQDNAQAPEQREPATQEDPDKGYPADTPISEMTDAQQAAYWKTQARKHEAFAKKAKDYDQVVAERDELRTKAMTEQEKAVEAARAEGRAEAKKQASEDAARAILQSSLMARGIKQDSLESLMGPVNVAAFVDDKGEVQVDRIHTYAAQLAPASNPSPPDMGQGGSSKRNSVSSVSAGADLWESRHGKTNPTT